jgi:hypothetical protein
MAMPIMMTIATTVKMMMIVRTIVGRGAAVVVSETEAAVAVVTVATAWAD